MTEKPEVKQIRINVVKAFKRPLTQYRRRLGVVWFINILFLFIISISLSSAALNVNEIISAHMSAHYPWKNIRITNIRTMGDLGGVVPDRITVEKGPIGKAVFAFYSSGKRVLVKANIKAYDWIVKSKRPFSKGHVIEEDDVYIEKMDIDRMPRGALNKPDTIIGKSLKRSIIANIPLVENMVEKYQVVKRGKMVKLIIGNEDFSISASGKTKEKGYVGKPVRTMNLSSKKVVTGVLIDESTVKVAL